MENIFVAACGEGSSHRVSFQRSKVKREMGAGPSGMGAQGELI